MSDFCAVFLGSNVYVKLSSVRGVQGEFYICVCTLIVGLYNHRCHVFKNSFSLCCAHTLNTGLVVESVVSNPAESFVAVALAPGVYNLESTCFACVNLVVFVYVNPDFVIVSHKSHSVTAYDVHKTFNRIFVGILVVFRSIRICFEVCHTPTGSQRRVCKDISVMKSCFDCKQVCVVGRCDLCAFFKYTHLCKFIVGLYAVSHSLSPDSFVSKPIEIFGVVVRNKTCGCTAVTLQESVCTIVV